MNLVLLSSRLFSSSNTAILSAIYLMSMQYISFMQYIIVLIGMLKVNMGNIYLKQRNYSKAIKFYRMALDQIASVHKEMR